ncbi:hypothetical protein [Serratia oryzae]|uniref:hypothetical protein n=1 Tax=Serratia oryzae TaxID=2034155 RepID=UPI001300D0F6|nr:hypothetical protein [Serratia oryzae]
MAKPVTTTTAAVSDTVHQAGKERESPLCTWTSNLRDTPAKFLDAPHAGIPA